MRRRRSERGRASWTARGSADPPDRAPAPARPRVGAGDASTCQECAIPRFFGGTGNWFNGSACVACSDPGW